MCQQLTHKSTHSCCMQPIEHLSLAPTRIAIGNLHQPHQHSRVYCTWVPVYSPISLAEPIGDESLEEPSPDGCLLGGTGSARGSVLLTKGRGRSAASAVCVGAACGGVPSEVRVGGHAGYGRQVHHRSPSLVLRCSTGQGDGREGEGEGESGKARDRGKYKGVKCGTAHSTSCNTCGLHHHAT